MLRHLQARILLLGESRRWDDTVVQAQDGFDESGHARRALGVAQVALDRSDPAGPQPIRAVQLAERLDLDHVAENRSGAVRLDEVDVIGSDARPSVGLADHLLLRPPVRCGDAVASSVGIDRAAFDHRVDREPRLLRVGQTAQDEHRHTFAAHDPIGVAAERFTPRVRRRQARLGVEHADSGRQHEIDTPGDGLVAIARRQGIAREMHRDQRRRACRVDRDTRPFEVELVGQPVRGHEVSVAGSVLRGDRGVVAHLQVGPFVGHHADIDTGARARLRTGIEGGVLEGSPGGLQQQSLLRVHGLGFVRGDAEEFGVERVGVVDEAAAAGVDRAGCARGVVEVVGVPAARWDLRDRVAAVDQQLPQPRRVGGVGETAVEADDGDVGHAATAISLVR